MKKITKFKLLGGGDKGIEIHGIAITPAGDNRNVFTDDVIIKRKFPLNWKTRQLINRLRYPILVMTKHWRPEFSLKMNDTYSDIDSSKIDPKDAYSALLQTLWDASLIREVEFSKSGYKISGEVSLDVASIKANVLIQHDNDYNLYSMVEGILDELAETLLSMLQNPLGQYTADDARALIDKMGGIKEEDEDDISDDDIENLLAISSKRGMGVMLDSNRLGELAEHANEENISSEEEEEDEDGDGMHQETTTFDDMMPSDEEVAEASPVSSSTEDHDAFEDAQEPIE